MPKWPQILFIILILAACTACQGPTLEKAAQAKDSADFVRIPAGEYIVGSKGHYLNPLRKVTLESFEISKKEVTNAEFEAFVNATDYRTLAEKRKTGKVFFPGLAEFKWKEDTTAYWRFPNGKSRGGIEDKMDHPVTAISFYDVQAYCKWAKVRLPTLDEWEVACRAGTNVGPYFWGADSSKISEYANIWLGKDHLVAQDGDPWMTTSPVGSLEGNAFGLYDVFGNVFEFCADRPDRLKDQDDVASARGGSWWCSENACSFFNANDIGRVKKQASFSNQGFRVVKLE